MFNAKVKVIKRFERPDIQSAIRKGTESGGKEMADIAISMVRVDSGELKNSIEFTIFDEKTGTVKGKVHTAAIPQAMTLEYGTGIYNELGSSAKITWYVHESMADLSKYNFETVLSKKGLFYKVYGAHPHPYMKPAFDAAKDFVVQSVADEIRKLL